MPTVNRISVLLQAKNEAAFIERCVRSLSWADEIVLLDSGSTDDTVEIATRLGVVCHSTEDYPGWAEQFNRAAQRASNDWVFALDCDEIVTPELGASIRAIAQSEMDPADGYSVNRCGDFLGILLPNSSNRRNQSKTVRLYNRTRVRFADDWQVHQQLCVPGKSHRLEGDLLHWRGYTMDEYFRVFNQYATLEATALKDRGEKAGAWSIITRPILRFGWLYVVKGEYRLGVRGLIHAGLKACSEFMRYSKLWELENVPQAVLHPVENENAHPGVTDRSISK